MSVSSGTISLFQGNGSEYTATFTPSDEGTVEISIESSSFSDAVGNSNTMSEIFAWTYDVTRPTFTITSSLGPSGLLTNEPSLDLIITASEYVNGFSISGIDVEGVDKSAFASSNGTVFTTTLTYTENDVHYLAIDANVSSDIAGLLNTESDIFEWTYDDTSPIVTITASEGTSGFMSNDEMITLKFITSETSDFGESSIEIIGGILSSFSVVNSTTYEATFVPSGGDGLKTISVRSGAFSDMATNTNDESVVFEWNFDSTSPTISIESVSGSSGFISEDSNITLVFTTSEYTDDFAISDINVTGGHVGNFEGNGTLFTCFLAPYCCEETVEMNVLVNNGAFLDASTNLNVESDVFTWTYDISSESESFVTSTEGIIVFASGGAVALVLLVFAIYYTLHSAPVPSTSKPTDLTKIPGDGIETTFSSSTDQQENPLHTL